jgi:SAM-dependent methyltransferase
LARVVEHMGAGTEGAEAVVTDGEGNSFLLRPWPCPTCRRPATKVLGLRGGPHHRYKLGIVSVIKQCRVCRLVFPDPFPFPVDAQRLYADPAKYFERHDQPQRIEAFRGELRKLIELSGRERPSLLDVGSGRGDCLRAAQLEGLTDITGLEFSSAMIESAREKYGIELLPETIEAHAERVTRTYDIIVLAAVMEHVYEPDAMVAAAARLSHPGTVFYADVPKEESLLTLVGKTWNRLTGRKAVYNLAPTFTPFHVYGYNLRALEVLLAQYGFRIVDSLNLAVPHVPASGGLADRARAFVGTQINRLANLTGTAPNIVGWATKV